MTLLTKKQFAAMAGVTTSYLSKYIARGKITMAGDLISDTDPANVRFVKTRQLKRDKAPETQFSALENEFLFEPCDYLPEMEKRIAELNEELPAGMKLLPVGLVEVIALSAVIEVSKEAAKRELVYCLNQHLSILRIQRFYEAVARKVLNQVQNDLRKLADDIHDSKDIYSQP